jgi:hypothetical protein
MKLSKFLNVLVTVEGVRRPRILMDNAVQMGRSMDQDRFIYQWPQCDDMKCGKSNKEIKEAKAAGCVIHEGDNDYITADQGSIQYPLNGNSYTNFEKCIWQIRPKTANKFLKFKITHFDTEYDQYCGLDKLHVYADIPENFGGRKNENQNRIARVCGGQSGPKFQQHNFFDAVGALARYADNTCPKNNRNKRHRKCKIEGNEEFFDIDHEIMTLVFETDSNTSKDHTGFRIEWDVYDRPDPTPPPPSNMPANVLQRWTSEKLTHNIWGIFRFARTYVTCSQQQIKSKQCHNRHKIQRANRGKHRFIEAQRLLRHTQNYQPRNCVRGDEILPQTFRERQVALKGGNSNPSRMEDTLQLWYDTQVWKMSRCTSQNAKSDLQRVRDKLNRIMGEVFQRNNVF